MSDDLISETALQIVALSDTGQVTLSGIEKMLRDFVARGRAAQAAVDEIIAAEQAKRGDS